MLRTIGKKGIYSLADNISKLNFDKKVSTPDPNLVKEIASTSGIKNVFSFASKYCAVHNPTAYSIYDSVVEKLFPKYTKIEHAKNPKNVKVVTRKKVKDWKKALEYNEFNEAIGTFLKECGFDEIGYPNRQEAFDRFLWEQGKANN